MTRTHTTEERGGFTISIEEFRGELTRREIEIAASEDDIVYIEMFQADGSCTDTSPLQTRGTWLANIDSKLSADKGEWCWPNAKELTAKVENAINKGPGYTMTVTDVEAIVGIVMDAMTDRLAA